MSTLFTVFHSIQKSLFPWLEETFDPLTKKEEHFVQVISLMDLPAHMSPYRWRGKGRMPEDRTNIAKAFIAKAYSGQFSKSIDRICCIEVVFTKTF